MAECVHWTTEWDAPETEVVVDHFVDEYGLLEA